jgi:hypothetical protein
MGSGQGKEVLAIDKEVKFEGRRQGENSYQGRKRPRGKRTFGLGECQGKEDDKAIRMSGQARMSKKMSDKQDVRPSRMSEQLDLRARMITGQRGCQDRKDVRTMMMPGAGECQGKKDVRETRASKLGDFAGQRCQQRGCLVKLYIKGRMMSGRRGC